jgi:hypothetical protein
MFGTMAVKHIAIDEKSSPTRNESGGIRRRKGLGVRPAAKMTTNTIDELIRLFVAPHRISPAITSSIFIGVAMMASNVFWKYIRTKEA